MSKKYKTLLVAILFSLLLATPVFTTMTSDDTLSNLGKVVEPTGIIGSNLPQDLSSNIGFWVKLALSVVGITFFILMIYAGMRWMLAQGEEESVKKARSTIIMAVIGLMIVVSAYAITQFVTTRVIEQQTGSTYGPDLIDEGPLGCCVDWLGSTGMIPTDHLQACYVTTEANCKLQGENEKDGHGCPGPASGCWEWHGGDYTQDPTGEDQCVTDYCS